MSWWMALWGVLALLTTPASAQERIPDGPGCTYSGVPEGAAWAFASDAEARQAVARIMRVTGITGNRFEIKAADVANAQARIVGEKRLILYNQEFMKRVNRTTNTDWAAVSILAHEIGHHLEGHTLGKDGSRPEKELEADRFSGHVLYRLDATLDEAKAAMEALGPERGSATHPGKKSRIAAIANGWYAAQELAGERKPAPAPQPQTRPQPVPVPVPVPVPNATPQVVATCSFYSEPGIVYQVLSDNQIVVDVPFVGRTVVAQRQPSTLPNFIWMYQTLTYTYGVDRNGGIWGPNGYGGFVRIGDVAYASGVGTGSGATGM